MDCSNCQYRYDEEIRTPHILPGCGHTFCICCLTSLFFQQAITCPICSVTSPANSPKKLPINKALLVLSSSHQICGTHKKPIEAYCDEDESLACINCILENHQSHQISSIEKAAHNEKEKLLKIQFSSQKIYKNLKEAESHIERSLQTLDLSFKTVFHDIQQMYSTLKRKIQEREEAVFAELNAILNREIQTYNEAKEKTISQIDSLQQINDFISQVSLQDPFSILQGKKGREKYLNVALAPVTIPKYSDPFESFSSDKEIMNLQTFISGPVPKKVNPKPMVRASTLTFTTEDGSHVTKTKHVVQPPKYPFKSELQSKPQTIKIQGRFKTPQSMPKWKIQKRENIVEDEFSVKSLDLGSLCDVPSQLIYTIGGYSEKENGLSIETFDIAQTGQWERIGNPTHNRTQFAAVPYEGDILLIGGKVNGKRVSSSESFSLISHEFRHGELSLKEPRSGFGCVSVRDSLIVAGGNDGNPIACTELFNGQVWSRLPSLNEKRDELGLVCGPDLSIYAIGGANTASLASVERLDLRMKEWELLPSLSIPRRALAAVSLPDGIYAIGGYNGRQYLNSVEKFEIRMNRWTEVAAMKYPRCTLSAVASQDCQYVYAIGGFCDMGLDWVEKYSVVHNQWSVVESLTTPRFMHASLLILDK